MKTKMLKFIMWLTGYNMRIVEFIKPILVESVICNYFRTTKCGIYKRSRELPYMYHRQLIQYFMKNLTKLENTDIGKRTGGYDRVTINHSIKVILNYIETDPNKRNEISEIEQRIER